jgi:serine/threonine protein kinase
MPLAAGTSLGPYEILAPLGAGGMGEVYRAKDTKLKRDVALKVLPEAFSRDPGRAASCRGLWPRWQGQSRSGDGCTLHPPSRAR